MKDHRPDGYHAQAGCWCCGFVFVFANYNDPVEYYCMRGAPPRPPSLSPDEEPFGVRLYSGPDEPGVRAARAAWDAWAEGRNVNAVCICPYWMAER